MSFIQIKKNRRPEFVLSLNFFSFKNLVKNSLKLICQIIFYFNLIVKNYLWHQKLLTLSLSLILGLSFSITVLAYPKLISAQKNEPISPLAVSADNQLIPKRLSFKNQVFNIKTTLNLAGFQQEKAKNTALLAPDYISNQIEYLLIKADIKEAQLLDEFKILKNNNGWYKYKITEIKEIKKTQIYHLNWQADCVILIDADNTHYQALIAKLVAK